MASKVEWTVFVFRLTIAGVLALSLAACATPADLPLPTRPELAPTIGDLQHDGLDPTSSLTVSQVALLAVRNDPDLQAVRAQHGVAQAQVPASRAAA